MDLRRFTEQWPLEGMPFVLGILLFISEAKANAVGGGCNDWPTIFSLCASAPWTISFPLESVFPIANNSQLPAKNHADFRNACDFTHFHCSALVLGEVAVCLFATSGSLY